MSDTPNIRLNAISQQIAPSGAFYLPQDVPFDAHRPLRAIIVGAGIAGISAAVLLPNKVPNLSYTLYEKNNLVSGTWAENTYPGVRCDIPSHVYQLTFAPNLNWSEYYPKGQEIREYYEQVVKDYGVEPNLKLKHQVISAKWDKLASEWEVQVKNLETDEIIIDRANFLISAQGRLNHWVWPDISGLTDRFKGTLVHTSNWPKDLEIKGKRVAIIGNGASGQQLLPNILKDVSHIDHYIRSKTWVTPRFANSLLQATAEQPGGLEYTQAQKKEWKENPASYLQFRKNLEINFHARYQGGIKGSPENEAFRKLCLDTMRERLGGDEEFLRKITPDYAPGCKRPTPAPGYIEALRHEKVDFVTEPIIEATEKGLRSADGTEREVDIIITATGHSDGFVPRFPTIGENDVDLSKLWARNGPIGYPQSYFGIMAPGFPNYFFILQAQGNGGGGSVPLQCEISSTYIAKSIRKVQSQSYASLAPSVQATTDFNTIIDHYFDDKVSTDTCNSWFKTGPGKSHVVIHWPGTGHHRFDILRDPRWEDFVFERRKGGAQLNRYEYFGNGWTERERKGEKERIVGYLREVGREDLATVHESWNS